MKWKRTTRTHVFGSKVSFSVGFTPVDDKARADMFLPIWLLSLGIFACATGTILLVVFLVNRLPFVPVFFALALLATGTFTILLWKNHSIRILSEDSFEYKNFYGSKRVFRFSDIKGMRRGIDCKVLLVGDARILIDSSAILSEELRARIHTQLDKAKCV